MITAAIILTLSLANREPQWIDFTLAGYALESGEGHDEVGIYDSSTGYFNSNDEDRIAGTDDIWRLVDFCYAAIDTGYTGWFGEDQFTYRTEQVESMRLSREFFANCMKKALMIYARKPELQAAQATGDAGRTIQLVKKIIYNG